jgi:cytochrome c oxidase subunit II
MKGQVSDLGRLRSNCPFYVEVAAFGCLPFGKIGVVVDLGIPLLLAGAAPATNDLSIFDPASPPATSIRTLSVLVLAITAFIFVVVEGILVYSLFRFRRIGPAGTVEPPQVYGSQPIEIAWTAAPMLVVFVLILVTARTLWEVNVPPPLPKEGDHTLFVTVIGHQWWWEYVYTHYDGKELRSDPDQQALITANELHVPASDAAVPRRVYLTLKSDDVCHSFWVPRLAGKTDLIPGRVNAMWFQTDQPGLYLGQCAEYCGTQHAHMLLRVVVDPSTDFETWLENQRKPAVEARAASAGRTAFLSHSCVNCHRIRGTPANGSYAPDLTHMMSRDTLASGMVENDRDNLRRWVANPQQIKEGCLMPDFGLGDKERDDIVRYLGTLR